MASQAVGHWKIVDFPSHPECTGYYFDINADDQTPNMYRLNTRVVNSMFCSLEHDTANDQWTLAGGVGATMMMGPPEEMKKEDIINDLISNIQNLQVEGGQALVIRTKNGEEVRLQRS
ncbi:unnamed protein product [Rotaria sp. Silwood1]|nr:unnamed protein product [Rotaria sp. Silwood1]CAF3845161.1 unnamed protein product [Rotaria sp. Silwood1]CAF3917469.1 unnamed protein product [Rotaria sp. Silwood1]CAF4822892.1 unnamed protein product [Rotaria sp. Silwood1]CAF4841713.1 unnamed protein product [Rotaria sp. Silwood1]